MKMNIRDFYTLVDSEKEPDESMLPDLESLTKKYPFFQAGIFVYIKCLYLSDSDHFQPELKRLSSFVHDRKALFYYVMSDIYKQFYKNPQSKKAVDRTDILINAFFETHEDPDMESRLEHAIVNSSMASFDYFSFMESSHDIESTKKESDAISLDDVLETDIETILQEDSFIEPVKDDSVKDVAEMKSQSIIDSFISKAEDANSLRIKFEPLPESSADDEALSRNEDGDETEQELDDDFFFTQTLANIYIKQKKYNRAYEIIKRLGLNYPEKNIYFADQLSFLEKLIKNTNNK